MADLQKSKPSRSKTVLGRGLGSLFGREVIEEDNWSEPQKLTALPVTSSEDKEEVPTPLVLEPRETDVATPKSTAHIGFFA